MAKITHVQKRDKTIIPFEEEKVRLAAFKALTASGEGNGVKSKKVAKKVTQILARRFKKDETPNVEQIQDIVEEVLILEGFIETAKAYILYRDQRRKIRETAQVKEEAIDRIDDYLDKLDWEVNENANMAYSLQGLNHYGVSYIVKKYWLNKIYPKEIQVAVDAGEFHIHNLDTLACYTFFGREVIVVKLNNQIKLISFKDLYDEVIQSETLLSEKDQAFAKYPENLYILDRDNWTKISRMVRKKKEIKMRFIKSEQGRSVIVTDNHPFIIKKNEEEDKQEVEAKDVQEKKDLIFSADISHLLKAESLFFKKYIYLAEELISRDHQDFFLEGFEWQDFVKNWGGSLKVAGTLSTSNSANSLNNQLELSEDLGYLVGIFIAEGNYHSWRLVITNDDEEIIKRVQRICAKLGVRSYIKENEERTKQISINSSTLKLVFEKIFQIKTLSQNKNLPLDILTYNYDFIRGVIAGIIDGDGTVDSENKANGASQVLIRVSSRTMLEQISLLLQFFGIIARDRTTDEDIGKVNVFQGKKIIQNYPIYGISFSKKEGVNLPSIKYQKAKIAKKHWRAEKYGWNKVLNNNFTAIADDIIYDITTDSGTFLCNGLLVHNCMGWDLYDLLLKGFGGVSSKVESKPPKHLRTAMGQIVNFLYTLQGECAGAVAFSNFDTLLAPFIRYDDLNYQQVKQTMQEFLYNMAVPTRVGFQCPFSNITLDLKPSQVYANQPVIVGGLPQKETYGEFQEEMKMFNKALYEVMLEGDKSGRPFHFPIPTINITKDFPWDDPTFDSIFEASAKYGINYFANYINSEMKPEDARSMCCRLRLDLKELYNRGGGGLFGAGSLTGSIGVVTINLPRIGYTSKTKHDFFEKLGKAMDLSKESLEIKRKTIENFITKGLYPYSRYYLAGIKKARGTYFANHFSTIGLIGMNEALTNFLGEAITSRRGKKFALEVMDFMRKKLVQYQKETNHLYNLEATPAESTGYRLAQKDRKLYGDIKTAGTKTTPYYTNSTQLPVNYTDDVFKALQIQDDLQCRYTGGCIEKENKVLTDQGLLNIEYIVNNFKKIKPIKTLSYNKEKGISEWDKIIEAVKINVKKHNKIRIKGERNLDIITSDWHPFFVLEKFKPNLLCPICKKEVKNIKAFAVHIKWNLECQKKYKVFPKFSVIEKRADELKFGDYILQNSYNLYANKKTELNNDLMWLIGFFIGDGCISEFIDNRGGNNLKKYKIRFFSEHKEALDKVVKILNKYFHSDINVIQNDRRSKLLKEASTSKSDVLKFFFRYGFWNGEKAYNIFVPQKVKKNFTRNNVYSFLAGLMDSDGHIGKKTGEFEYYTVSPRLAEDVLEICARAGIMVGKNLKIVKRKNEVNIWRLRIPRYELTKIKDQLTNTVHSLRIEENLSNRKKRYLPVVRVKKVSKVDVRDNQFYDLMTEKNHNYLAGKNCLVFIHNTVFHTFLGEKLPDAQAVKNLVKKIFTNFSLPYITITPTFSICPVHGYISGEHFNCPKCVIKQPCEVYSRVVGYLRPVQQWNEGKQKEFHDRKTFKATKVTL